MYKQNKMTHVDIKVPKLSFLKMNITINIFCHSPILQHRPTLTLETSVSTTAKLTRGGNLCVEKKNSFILIWYSLILSIVLLGFRVYG